MNIYCCCCEKNISAKLTDGSEIYPRRRDLYDLPFWKCDVCNNYVGCHHETKNRIKPLGCIVTKEVKKARIDIHKLIDPYWKSGKFKRSHLYFLIGKKLERTFHIGEIKSIAEAREVYLIASSIVES